MGNLAIYFEMEPVSALQNLLNLAEIKLFQGNDFKKKEFDEFSKKFTSIYNWVQEQFKGKKRRTGEDYISHLELVTERVLMFNDITEETLFAAILHDTVEDIPFVNFEDIVKVSKSVKVAILVESLTKKSLDNYCDVHSAQDLRLKIAKYERNREFLSTFLSKTSKEVHIQDIANTQNIILSHDEIEYLANQSIIIKACDRDQNITTATFDDIQKTIQMINDTYEYLMGSIKVLGNKEFVGQIEQHMSDVINRVRNQVKIVMFDNQIILK